MLALVVPLTMGGDDAFYLETARNLLHGCYCVGGHFTTFRPPGYSAFLALLGAQPVLALIAQLLGGAATAVLTYRLLDRTRMAFWTAILIGTSPFLIASELKIYSEALYIPLVWIGWLFLYKGRPITAGLLLGLAILTRDTLVLLPAFLAILSLFKREWLRPALTMLAAAYLVALPWQLASHDSRMGYNLWVGTWERNNTWMINGIAVFSGYPDYAFRSAEEKRSLAVAFARGDDKPFKEAALERLTGNPGGILKVWLSRYWRLWIGTRMDQVELRAERGSPLWVALKAGFFGLNLLVLAFGFFGLWRARRTPFILLAVPVAYAAFIYVPFHNTETRYSLFALPFLYAFAAHAFTAFRTAKAKTRASESEPPDRFSTVTLNEPAAMPLIQYR
jgi:4-amino-4-deoxy-L-arabinose transferase-like glycosyltransferase